MKEIRSKQPIRMEDADSTGELATDIPAAVEKYFPADNEEKRYFGLVSMALLLIGNGFTDEAHNIVTPLSWPEDTHFGYGPSVFSEISPVAQSYATYVHCLVHRREAFNIGEFGMVGFANANYWSNAVLRSPGVRQLPHQDLLRRVRELVKQYKSLPDVEEWARRHQLLSDTSEGETANPYFESRMVHELCANVLRRGATDEFTTFAERVAETEVRILLSHALQHAGYDCNIDALSQGRDEIYCAAAKSVAVSVDESLALVAANKVSSAHLGIFRSNHIVTLRNVAGIDKLNLTTSPSVAAGISTRLLQSPACRPLFGTPTDGDVAAGKAIWVAVPASEIEAESIRIQSGGGSLAPGDALAVSGDGWVDDYMGPPWYCMIACETTDDDAYFVDSLYGTRGETPTTVVQWSKGTIF